MIDPARRRGLPGPDTKEHTTDASRREQGSTRTPPDLVRLYDPRCTPEERAAILGRARTPVEHGAARPAPPARVYRCGRAVAVVVLVALVATALVLVHADTRTARPPAQHPSASAQLSRSIVSSRGAVTPAVLYARFPRLLAARWRERPRTSGARLDGATAVPLPRATSRLLLVAACSQADRSFEYVITPTGADRAAQVHGYGVCGSLRPIEVVPPAAAAQVLVTTRGVDPFSITVVG